MGAGRKSKKGRKSTKTRKSRNHGQSEKPAEDRRKTVSWNVESEIPAPSLRLELGTEKIDDVETPEIVLKKTVAAIRDRQLQLNDELVIFHERWVVKLRQDIALLKDLYTEGEEGDKDAWKRTGERKSRDDVDISILKRELKEIQLNGNRQPVVQPEEILERTGDAELAEMATVMKRNLSEIEDELFAIRRGVKVEIREFSQLLGELGSAPQ